MAKEQPGRSFRESCRSFSGRCSRLKMLKKCSSRRGRSASVLRGRLWNWQGRWERSKRRCCTRGCPSPLKPAHHPRSKIRSRSVKARTHTPFIPTLVLPPAASRTASRHLFGSKKTSSWSVTAASARCSNVAHGAVSLVALIRASGFPFSLRKCFRYAWTRPGQG